MKKLIIVFMLLALFGCSSSGDNGGSSSNDSYIGFTAEDFSGKTIYLVETDIGWSKAVFNTDGSVEAYDPNQENWYAKGTWEIVNGKLVVAREESPDHKTTYTFINEDAENNIFTLIRDKYDGTVDTVWMFYNQDTGFQQAQDFVNNNYSL